MFSALSARKKTEYTQKAGLPVIYNYAKHTSRRARKRALLSYITHPFLAEERGENINRFSNSGLALSWVQVLNELGYIVDIIDWDNTHFTPDRQYDLVVFHGGKNFKNIYPCLTNKPIIIHFLTGSYWKVNNQQEDRRRAAFKRRHGMDVPRDRYIYASEDEVNHVSNAIIVLGDPSMKTTYPRYRSLFTINNASYPDDHFDKALKHYPEAKRNYLFFAGSGNVHKGLDLLIDSFKDLDEHLYIVTVLDRKVLSAFRNELKLPNIHLLGEVGLRSPEFYEIMDKCAFVILPSCSEGQAGSVVEAMNQGLIPIVSKETRLDARSYGVVLENNKIETIKQTVRRMSAFKSKEVEKMAKRVRGVALKEHSPEKFRRDLAKAVLMITEKT